MRQANIETWASGLAATAMLVAACSGDSNSPASTTSSQQPNGSVGTEQGQAGSSSTEPNAVPTLSGMVSSSGGEVERPGPMASELPNIETPNFSLDGDLFDGQSSGGPRNVGTELLCDGIDENGNGIIDDVDVGRDGLCDCLRIGFIGSVASDAGDDTAAFETWLAERSDIPVTQFEPGDILTPGALDGLQVIIVGNLAARANSGGYSPAEVNVLREWVEVQGGGMITLAGYTASEADIVPTIQLLEPSGLSYDYQGRGSGIFGTGAPPFTTRGLLNTEHPTMDTLVAMGVYNAYPVIGDGEVLIREGNFNLAMAKSFGEGVVFAFSDEWITQDSLWYPLENLPLTQCQQQCAQCETQCNACDRQCDNCQAQPCQGGQVVPDGGTCIRGCDNGCSSCSSQCNACEPLCDACRAEDANDRLDIPRFWLNTLRWLTPENECKVPIPSVTIF